VRAVIQRVRRAEVRVEGEVVGRIDAGVCILLGVLREDDEARARTLARRVFELRFFEDDEGRMGRSLGEVEGAALVVSQVTLAASTAKGRRPSLDPAAEPRRAAQLYETFAAALGECGVSVATGRFGARMEVELVNDGPVTFLLEEPRRLPG